ncbi:hypothetical protein UNPA324_11095 [Bradyrhizobium sp. UNPA324]|nr:hypothetical protein UNPA324_11095 [Bradyrhizobium sp. UNPA324]
MHSRHEMEIIGLFKFGKSENEDLLRRARQGQNGMMRLASTMAPHSVVMPRLDRGIQYAAADVARASPPTKASGILDRPVEPGDDS